MDIKDMIKNIGTYILGIAVMLALFSIPILFIYGGVFLGEKVLPWLMLFSLIAIAVNILIFLPLTIIPMMRPWAGIGFFISSYLFGLTGWLMGLLLTWMIWGGGVVFLGLCFMGIGIVPIGIAATLFHGMWFEFSLLIVAVILTYGLRILGMVLTENA